MRKKQILYVDSFTCMAEKAMGSDMVGYGITASNGLLTLLSKEFDIIQLKFRQEKNIDHYLTWIISSYEAILQCLQSTPPDLIFIFHAFHQFPAEIKRMLCVLNLNIPMVGYTHGSHWDCTDTYRTLHYKNLEFVDLANFTCLDKIFITTNYFKTLLEKALTQFNSTLIAEKKINFETVGLPIYTKFIDSFNQQKNKERINIIFNHTLIPSKNPSLFFQVAEKVLMEFDHVQIIFTRKDTATGFILTQLEDLEQKYKNIITHSTMTLPAYFALLWQSHIQVSTATHESLGVATLEAMYTENCAILPDHACYPEITFPLREHLYQYNKEELFTRLVHFITDEHARIRLAKAQAKLALKYSEEQVGSAIVKSIKTLI